MPRGFTRNSNRRGCCSHTVSMRLSIEKVRFVARPAISLTTGYYFFVWETFRHSFKGTNVLSPPNIHARRADGVQGCQSGIFISQFWELWGMSGKSLGIGLFLGIFGNIEKNWEILAKFRDFLIF